MAEYSLLKSAPITEALIDIRIRPKERFDVDRLMSLHDAIAEQYPDKKTRHKWEGRVEFKEGETPVPIGAQMVDGYIFTSADGKQILQAQIDGFTFNRLKPYDKWETFRDEAFKLWQMYQKLVEADLIRVALRYINKFDIPLPIRDFNEYLSAAPIVPEGLPQGISSFLTRVVIHEPELDGVAIITQAFEQIVDPNFLPIILDIDVFKQESKGITEEEAWKILEKLRNVKNKIFFASITEKVKELFR